MKATTSAGLTPATAAAAVENNANTMLGAADAAAALRIQSLTLVHQSRVSRLTRTANAAVAEFGATSPEAVAAQQDLSIARTTAGRMGILQRQAGTAAPVVAAAGWALHGRVYSVQLQPSSGYTVFLVDDQKRYQSAYGFAYTDSTGYFLINTAGKAAAASSRKAAQATSIDLFVEIANTAGHPVYLSAEPFRPGVGNAIYQNVTLPAGEPVLGDPPEDIRRSALPPENPQT